MVFADVTRAPAGGFTPAAGLPSPVRPGLLTFRRWHQRPQLPPLRRHDLHTFHHHWQDEADAAYLYRLLSDAEPDAQKKDLYRRLAEVEDRHVEVWAGLLRAARPRPGPLLAECAHAAAGACSGKHVRPEVPAADAARRRGPRGQGLSRHAPAHARAARRAPTNRCTLARESAEHATTLGEISGKTGEPWHRAESGGLLRNVVYGFNDGLTANFGLVAGVIGAAPEQRAPHRDPRRRRRAHRRRAVDGIERLSRREERAGSVRERDRDGARRDRAHARGRARRAGADLRGQGHVDASRRARWRPR